eukprot:1179984-Prorocentrum_minimum.AAC.1
MPRMWGVLLRRALAGVRPSTTTWSAATAVITALVHAIARSLGRALNQSCDIRHISPTLATLANTVMHLLGLSTVREWMAELTKTFGRSFPSLN